MTSSPSRLDRLLAAYPVLLAYILVLILYAWQTTKHSSPWLFTDELQWAEQSRGVAHHGVEELRGQQIPFKSLYSYFLAPAWWTGTTSSGYATAKYLNAIVMAASLFPGYALARVFVPRWAALACGLATAAIPAAAYVSLLVPEPLAYFWSTLALCLLGRALVRPTARSMGAAILALLIGPAIRSELTVLLLVAALSAVVMTASSARGSALIRSWSLRERLGASVLLVGGLIFLGALGDHHSGSWQIGTHFHDRMLTYGLWAMGAFTIGIGILPAVIALAWLLGNRFRTEPDRALGGLLLGVVVAFGLYTAVKASYLSTNFAIRVEERNLIYIAPVVFAVVAHWALTARTRIVPLALATAAVWYLLDTTPYHNEEHFYSDAPGLSVLQWLNQKIYFNTTDAHRLVYGILIGTVVLIVVREVALGRRQIGWATVPAGVLLAIAVVGWNLWGEIAAAKGARDSAAAQRSVLPSPPYWIDAATGNAPGIYMGQSMAGSNLFWSLEFWNQTLQNIWSTDATAPGPGPVVTPNYYDTTGKVFPQLDVDWMVAGPGVDPAGRLVEEAGGLRLFRMTHPIRIADALGNISTDGAHWMGASAFYYRFSSAGQRRGTAVVNLSRAAACGGYTPSTITVRLASMRIGANGQPAPKKLIAVRRVVVTSDPCTQSKTVRIPVDGPYRIDLTANKTFQPSQYDLRELSTQVTFGFEPAKS